MEYLDSLIPSALAESIGLTFMHALWQLAAVALVLLLVLQLVPRKASRTRYLLGAGSLALMPVLALTTFFLVRQAPPEPAPAPDLSAMISSGQILELEEHFAAREANMSFFSGITDFFNDNSRLLFALWALGSLLFAMRFLLGYIRVQRLRRQNTQAVPPEIQAILLRLRDKLGIRRAIQILQSGSVDTPMVIGAMRPVVLLPLGLLTGLSPEQVECILAHELAHIRRADYLVNIFQSMVEIVFFFHPAVWWVSNLVREERENCCDEAVLALKNDNIVYARALLNLESLRTSRPSLAMASSGGSLFKRIKRITGAESRETRFYSRGLFVAMLTLTLVIVLSTTSSEPIMASSPMVTFNDPEPVPDPGFPQQDSTRTPANASKVADQPAAMHSKLFGMGKVMEAVSGMQAQVASALEEGGKSLGRHLDDVLFAALLNEMKARQDSPVTKLILVEDGKEIVMEMDRDGNLENVLVDGKPAPKSDYDRYKRIASRTFRSYLGSNEAMPAPPSPPTPPSRGSMPTPPTPPSLPSMGKMPPMPAVPQVGKVPSPPAPPARGSMSDKEYEKAMDKYEDVMEKWGEKIEQQFESADWERFEEEMEAWGESLGESIEKNIESQDWEAFGEKMEAWGEEFAKQMESADWDKFGEEMERWGEALAQQMDEHAQHMEHHRDKIHDDAQQLRSGVDRLGHELESEGLIGDGDAYKIRINEDEFYVNGDLQPRGLHRRFKELIENDLGLEVGDEWVEINKKKGALKIKEHN